MELQIINIDRQKQFIIKLSSKDNRKRGVTITFLQGCSNEPDHVKKLRAENHFNIYVAYSLFNFVMKFNIRLSF